MAAYLNYPKDDFDMKWWSSRSKVNRCLAVIAFSFNKENAIQNLRRHFGYPYLFRHYHAWNNLGCYVNYKGLNKMDQLPFHDGLDPWYEIIPYTEVEQCWNPGGNTNPPTAPTFTWSATDVKIVSGAKATIGVVGGIKLQNGSTVKTIKVQTSTNGGTTWSDASGWTIPPQGDPEFGTAYVNSFNSASFGHQYRFSVVATNANGDSPEGISPAFTILEQTTTPALAWVDHPATGTLGTDLSYSWTGGVAPYKVVVLDPAAAEHDNKDPATSPYVFSTTPIGTPNVPGKWNIKVTDHAGTSITQDVQMAAKNVTVAIGDITVIYAGTNGSGTASTSTTIEGVTIALAPTTGLSNGNTVTATVTAKSGYTVNGKSSDTFTYTVSGLSAAPTYEVRLYDAGTSTELPKTAGVYQLSGVNGAAQDVLTVQVWQTGGTGPVSGGGNNFTISGGNTAIASITGMGATSHTATVHFNGVGNTTWTIHSAATYNATVDLKITVTAPNPTVTSVTVAPATTATIETGQTIQFSATVTGTNNPAQTVTWTASAGSITSAGVWTAPAATNTATTITATSTVDTSKSGTATVTKVTAVVKPVSRVRMAHNYDVLRPNTGTIINPAPPLEVTDSDGNIVPSSQYTTVWTLEGTPPVGVTINSTTGAISVAAGTDETNFDVKAVVTDQDGTSTDNDTAEMKLWHFDDTSAINGGDVSPGKTYQLEYNFSNFADDPSESGADWKYNFVDANGDDYGETYQPMRPTITLEPITDTDLMLVDGVTPAFTISPTGLITVNAGAQVGKSGTLTTHFSYGLDPAWTSTNTNHVSIVAAP